MAPLEKNGFLPLYYIYSVKKSKNFILATKTCMAFIFFLCIFAKNSGKSRGFDIFSTPAIVKNQQIVTGFAGENSKKRGGLWPSCTKMTGYSSYA